MPSYCAWQVPAQNIAIAKLRRGHELFEVSCIHVLQDGEWYAVMLQSFAVREETLNCQTFLTHLATLTTVFVAMAAGYVYIRDSVCAFSALVFEANPFLNKAATLYQQSIVLVTHRFFQFVQSSGIHPTHHIIELAGCIVFHGAKLQSLWYKKDWFSLGGNE